MGFSDRRWFRFLLRLYPAWVRERYGGEMEATYLRLVELARDDGGWAGAWWVRGRVAVEAVLRGALLRLRSRERDRGRAPGSETERRREGRGTMIERIGSEVRYALRSLRSQPLYLGAAVLTLGLGIGANTAVFSVVHGVVLSPLPVEEPERLVRIYLEEPEDPGGREYLTWGDYATLEEQDEVLSRVAAFYSYREEGADLSGEGRPERVRLLRVGSGYFDIVGVEPAAGRGLAPDEERDDARVAVLSHGLAERRFAAAAAAVGETIRLDDVAHTVVGVLPSGFRDPVNGDVQLYVPQDLTAGSEWNNWYNHYLSTVARLAPGVGVEEATERLRVAFRSVNEANRDADDHWRPRLIPLQEDLVGEAAGLLWVLLGAVGLVLLLACVNVANLSLARGVSRTRELAVRAAMGAGRGGLVRQLLGESLVVALIGGILGVAMAVAGVRGLLSVAGTELPRTEAVGVDVPVLLFTAGVTVLAGIAFGILPALRGARTNLVYGLKEGSRGNTGGAGRLRSVLVVVQVALALVLLVGAGLLVKSFAGIRDADVAIEPAGVLTYEVHLPDARYPGGEDRAAFHRTFHDRIRALPEVEAAGAVSWLPLRGRYNRWGLYRNEVPEGYGGEDEMGADVRVVEGDYFEALGIELLRGRNFEDADRADGVSVAVLNRRTVERMFPDTDPLGRTVRTSGRDFRVVGVVENVPNDHFGDVSAKVYLSHAQFAANRNWPLFQVVETRGRPGDVVGRLRSELAAIDPELVLHQPEALQDVVDRGVARQRLAATVMTVFAGLALVLAVVGIYGVLAFLVGRRTHEIGIRMALGARARDVGRLVVRQGLLLTAMGVGGGLLGAAWLSRGLRSLLFRVEPTDPWVYGAVALGMVIVATLAAWIPARRAAGVDPVRAFRAE